MAFTRSGVRSPSPPLQDWEAGGSVRHTDAPRYAVVRGQVRFGPLRGNSSVGRAQPCQGWGRGFESRFPLWHSDAGWSSLVARRAHNPEVVGSNPTPATSIADCGLRIADLGSPDSFNPQSPVRNPQSV